MEPPSDPFPGGFVSFGNGWSGTDELCWENPWQCPDARTPQTLPDPTDIVASAPGTVWALPQTRFCMQSLKTSQPC